MKSTDYWPRPAREADTSDSHFEQLRGAFYTRLRNDRARLATLSAELARTDEDVAPVLEELRVLAHRMCGAAAIFEAPDIGDAANTLEQTLLTAIDEHADGTDPAVSAALEALVNLLVLANNRSARASR
jgi:HPt (histidine-containing phosphotransfer) domain-containing protein